MASARSSVWLSAIVAGAIVIATSRPANAATPEAEHAAAIESFRRGTLLVERGNLQDAIEAFREALQHEPSSVGARLDLADCYEKVGAPAPAWREYTLAEGYAQRANDARRTLARSSAAHLEPRVLLVTLSGQATTTMRVRADGEAVADEIVARRTFALAPGSHRVEITAPGKRDLALDVTGRAGETRAIEVALVDDAPASRAPPSASGDASTIASADSSQKTWGLVLGGLGLAGIAAGSVTGLMAASKKTALESEATDPAIGPSRFYADRTTAKTFALVSTASFIAGGVGLAAGSILFLTAPSSRDRSARVLVRPTLGGVTIDALF
jgi:hypothetical protein